MAAPSTKGVQVDYEDRILAFVDIMGWSRIVEESLKDQPLRERIALAMRDLSARASTATSKYKMSRDPIVRVHHFSDVVAISSRVEPELKGSEAALVAVHAHVLAQTLFDSGILTRGAIVRGPLIHNETTIYGPALVKAYELERHVAYYPRVVVLDGIVETVLGILPDFEYMLQLDTDGLRFLSFLNYHVGPPGGDLGQHAKRTREFIVGGLELYAGDPRIRAKYGWLASYFNGVYWEREDLEVEPIVAEMDNAVRRLP